MQTPGITVEATAKPGMDEVEALYRDLGWTTYTDEVMTLAAALTGSSRVVAAPARWTPHRAGARDL